MLQLLDLNKNKIAGLIEYKDLSIESVLDTGDKTLTFTYSKFSKFYEDIKEEAYIRTKTDEFVIKAKEVQDDGSTFTCTLNVEDLEGHIIDRFESKEQTIKSALNLALVNTGWTVGNCDIKKKRTILMSNSSSWEIIQEIKKTYRIEIQFDTLNKKINVYEHIGSDKGTYFINSLNLTALSIQSNSYDFATRIIPVGKDGLTIESINNGKNYVENYQYSNKVKTIYWKDERYTIAENLKEDAEAKLNEISKPYRAYSASIINLAEINDKYKNILDYKLGDTITLISKDNKIREKQRIVKIKEYPNDHSKDTVELANAILRFEDIQKTFKDTTDTVDNITSDNGTVDGSTIDSIKVKQIEDFKANVIEVTNLEALNANISNLHANKADIQELNAVKANVGTLNATKANITELNSVKANIETLQADKADINLLNAESAKIKTLESNVANINTLVSQKASIDDLNALKINTENLLSKKASIKDLDAINGHITNLDAVKANVKDLTATNANIDSLKSDTADIKTLLNGNLSSENIQSAGITSDKLTIADGFIKNAMIDSIVANKIASGELDTSKIDIRSHDGNLVIKDNTIQIKDTSKVRVQIGKDNNGDYNIYVWDAAGNLMFDATGITEHAIKNSIIRNDMIADAANIDGSKLNIESVIASVNDSKTTIKASRINLDKNNQTLDIAFSKLQTSNDENSKSISDALTKIEVQQGQINSTIENSKIIEGKQKTLEDNYNRTTATINSFENTLGSHKTLIDSATGKINAVETKTNTIKKTLDTTVETLTQTNKTVSDNKTLLDTKTSELKKNIDGLSANITNIQQSTEGKINTLNSTTANLQAGLNGFTANLNSLKSKTETITTNLTTTTNDLNNKINSAKTEAINTASSDATNKANNALNSAKTYTNAQITTVNNNLSNATSEINVLKNQISTKVSQSDIDKSISNIKIGGRNLAFKTANESVQTGNNTVNQTNFMYALNIKELLGKQVTITFEWEVEGNNVSGTFYTQLNDSPWTSFTDRIQVSNSYKSGKVKKTISMPSSIPAGGIMCRKDNFTGTLKIRNLKVVAGNFANDDWTPAPEDVDQTIVDNIKVVTEKINNVGSELRQTKDSLQASVNSLNSTTQTITGNITNLNNDLNNKINSAKTDAINNSKSYADTKKQEAINAANSHADSIATSKSNEALNNAKSYTNAQVTTVNNNLSKATSEINVLKNQISTKVSQSDIDRTVNNIKIGGRNLALGTNCNFTEPYTSFNGGTNTCVSVGKVLTKGLNVDDTVTVRLVYSYENIISADGHQASCWIQGSGNVTNWNAGAFNGSDRFNVSGTGEHTFLYHFTISSNHIKNEYWDINIRHDYVKSGSIKWKEFKVEKGNKNTDWTPAPEDVNQTIVDNIKVVTDKINDVSSKLTQTKDSLQASVNSLNSTTQTITTNLTNTTNTLNDKINSAKTDAINNSKSYAEQKKNEAISSANSHADSVATSKSNEALNNSKSYTNAQITTVNNRVSTAESSINVLKNQISTKVSQTDIDKTVNSIKVGGRNLIRKTNTEHSNISWSMQAGGYTVDRNGIITKLTRNNVAHSGWSVIQFNDIVQNLSLLKPSTDYMLSFDVQSNYSGTLSAMLLKGNGKDGLTNSKNQSITANTWNHVVLKLTTIADLSKVSDQIIYITGMNNSTNAYYEFKNIKFEEGNAATNWTPAPEDVNQAISDNVKTVTERINTVESTFTQKTNNINATVSSVQSTLNTKADGNTVSSMQSQLSSLNVGLNGIKTEVSKKTDKTSIISAINQSAESIKINASKIELDGITTFSNNGLKAVEVKNNSVRLFNWKKNGEFIGMLTSTVLDEDNSKPFMNLANKKNSAVAIGYTENDVNFKNYIIFDKFGVAKNPLPITFYESISLNGYTLYFNNSKKNKMLENSDGKLVISAKHGMAINDIDSGKTTANLDSDRVGFSKWNQNYYYAEFSPNAFNLSDGNGKGYMWKNSNSDLVCVRNKFRVVSSDGNRFLMDVDDNSFEMADARYNKPYLHFGSNNFEFYDAKTGESCFWKRTDEKKIWTGKGISLGVQGDLTVSGKKNRVVETQYGNLTLNAVESTECWFTDMLIDQSKTDSNGDCIIWFDDKFLQTVNTRYKYKIDLTPLGEFASNGKLTYVRVVEKTEKYFKVRGTPNTVFDWTITAKQKGYERDRLEKTS